MSYQDITYSAVVDEFNRRAVSITYNGTEISGIFRLLDPEEKESTNADQASLKVLKTDVPAPKYNDKSIIESKTWTVQKQMKGGGAHTFKLLIERNRRRVR